MCSEAGEKQNDIIVKLIDIHLQNAFTRMHVNELVIT